MSIPDDLLKSRFYLNMNRITGLVKLIHSDIDSLKPLAPLQSEGVSADILRTIVVFLHATFEDVLRTTGIAFLFSTAVYGAIPTHLQFTYLYLGHTYLATARNELGLPSSLVFLFTHATLFGDPGRPSATSPFAVALYWLLYLRLHRRLLCWT